MVNYRVKDDMYIVDRLFEKAELILGSGKKARKVEIDRERKAEMPSPKWMHRVAWTLNPRLRVPCGSASEPPELSWQ